jgi:hypothetical protein
LPSIQELPYLLEIGLLAADHDGQARVAGADIAPRYGGVEGAEPFRDGGPGDAAGQVGSRRGRIYQDGARLGILDESGRPEVQFLDILGIADHGEDDGAGTRHGRGAFLPDATRIDGA